MFYITQSPGVHGTIGPITSLIGYARMTNYAPSFVSVHQIKHIQTAKGRAHQTSEGGNVPLVKLSSSMQTVDTKHGYGYMVTLTEHLWGFSPVCRLMCTSNMYCALNGLLSRTQPDQQHTNSFRLSR